MMQFSLKKLEPVDEEVERKIVDWIRPELNYICFNSIRAGILHLLIKAKDLNHSMSVEEIAKRLGKRHSVIIHHLERLSEWKLVKIVKTSKYGEKEKRRIWGLNLKYPNLILTVYSHILKTFYTVQELEKI